MRKHTTKSICQYCFNFNCSWHIRFEPVKGWKATPTAIPTTKGNAINSYAVKNCPQFISRDGGEVPLDNGRITLKLLGKMGRTRLSNLVREKGFKLIIEDGKHCRYYIEKK